MRHGRCEVSTPERDRPDRLAEIKQRYSINNDTRGDSAWLIVEVEGLRARREAMATAVRSLQGDRLAVVDVAHELLRTLRQFVREHDDPGTGVLALLSEAHDLLQVPRPGVPGPFAERDMVTTPDVDHQVEDDIAVVRSLHNFDCVDAPYQPEVGRAAEHLAAEVERLRAALAECLKLAEAWDQQAATHHRDYDRFIGSADDDTRMTARYVQGKSAIYGTAASSLREALALPTKDGARP